MDVSGLFLSVVIGMASAFAVTLFVVTVITHEPHRRVERPGKRTSIDRRTTR
jgi:hypothetical protein